jgi:hypothetical protein
MPFLAHVKFCLVLASASTILCVSGAIKSSVTRFRGSWRKWSMPIAASNFLLTLRRKCVAWSKPNKKAAESEPSSKS